MLVFSCVSFLLVMWFSIAYLYEYVNGYIIVCMSSTINKLNSRTVCKHYNANGDLVAISSWEDFK